MTHKLTSDHTIARKGGKSTVVKKNDRVTLIALHDEIAIVAHEKGERFSVKVTLIEEIKYSK